MNERIMRGVRWVQKVLVPPDKTSSTPVQDVDEKPLTQPEVAKIGKAIDVIFQGYFDKYGLRTPPSDQVVAFFEKERGKMGEDLHPLLRQVFKDVVFAFGPRGIWGSKDSIKLEEVMGFVKSVIRRKGGVEIGITIKHKV